MQTEATGLEQAKHAGELEEEHSRWENVSADHFVLELFLLLMTNCEPRNYYLFLLLQLIEMEKCEDGNEECLKRRVSYEVHLDYIYTQHHPKP